LQQKNKVSINKKWIFEHYREVQTRKNVLIDIFLMKKNSNELFRAALYKITLVLHKDVLFHLTLLA